MSQIIHYPTSIVKLFVRKFNSLNRQVILRIYGETTLQIVHEAKTLKKPDLLVKLFIQLKSAMKSISKKYIPFKAHEFPLLVKMRADENHIIIQIDGVPYIPPNKLVALFDLIFWYSYTSRTGNRPKDTKEGQQIVKAWKFFVKSTRSRIEHAKKIVEFSPSPLKCAKCGKETVRINVVNFSIGQEFISQRIPVCEKHKTMIF